jgi:hypothetical protein
VGYGRAVSAPQVGIAKCVVVMNLGARPFALINPEITWFSEECFDVWDERAFLYFGGAFAVLRHDNFDRAVSRRIPERDE